MEECIETNNKLYIQALGHHHPSEIINNDFFDSLDIGSDAQWVQERTGIQSRRSVMSKQTILDLRKFQGSPAEFFANNPTTSITDLSKPSWEALKNRLPNANPDLVLCGSSIPDDLIPANASMICKELDIQAHAFDCNSACSSFLNCLLVASSLLKTQHNWKTAAVFNPERYSMRLDYNDRRSAILFGDGCATAYIGPEAIGLEIVDIDMSSDPQGAELVQIKNAGCFQQNGKAVQRFAVSTTVDISRKMLEKHNLSADDLSYFISHQANLRMLQSVEKRLGLKSKQHLYNVDHFGNQGAAGAPAVLSTHFEQFQSGDLILLTVVGSGLTFGSCLLRKT